MREKYLNLSEAAKRLGRAPGTLYNRLSQGRARELRAVKVWGRWAIPESAVEEILRSKG